jgi:hypothetical protein
MSINLSICRVCLETKKAEELRSIFKKDMDNKSPAQVLKSISGIQVSCFKKYN